MTREITLTQGYVALVDDEDFDRLSQWKWHVSGAPRSPYAARWAARGKQVWMHLLVAGVEPGEKADHKNRNTMDNRRENLRPCTHQQNMRNRSSAAMSRGEYKGVVAHGSGFRAQIFAGNCRIGLGVFRTDIEAAVAYDRAALEHHGEFALFNFDPKRDWILPEPERLPGGRVARQPMPRTTKGRA